MKEISTTHCWEPDTEIPMLCEFEIYGTPVPYDRGDRDCPPSGGYVEDIRAVLTAVYNLDGEPVHLTLDESADLISRFNKLLDADSHEAREVEQRLIDEYNAQNEPDDAAYERAVARGWED